MRTLAPFPNLAELDVGDAFRYDAHFFTIQTIESKRGGWARYHVTSSTYSPHHFKIAQRRKTHENTRRKDPDRG